MTIPFLSGGADPNQIRGIQESLQGIFDPKAPARNALQLAMAGNQQLNQQWQDKYAVDKEGMERMFGRRVHELFATGQQSSEGMIEQEKRRLASTNAPLPTVDADTGITTTAAATELTGQTGTQRAQAVETLANTRKQGELLDFEAEVNNTERPFLTQNAAANAEMNQLKVRALQGDVAAIQRVQAYQQQADGIVAKYGNTPELLYQAYRAGKIEPQDLVAIMAVPEYEKLFQAQQDDYWKKKNNETSIWLQRQGSTMDIEEYIRRNTANRAGELSEASRGQFGTKTLYDLMSNPTEMARIRAMTQPPTEAGDLVKYNALKFTDAERLRQGAVWEAQARKQAELASATEFAIANDPKKSLAQRQAAAARMSELEASMLGAQGIPYNQYTVREGQGLTMRLVNMLDAPWLRTNRPATTTLEARPASGAPPRVAGATTGNDFATVAAMIVEGKGTLDQLRTATKADGSPKYTPAEIAQIQSLITNGTKPPQ